MDALDAISRIRVRTSLIKVRSHFRYVLVIAASPIGDGLQAAMGNPARRSGSSQCRSPSIRRGVAAGEGAGGCRALDAAWTAVLAVGLLGFIVLDSIVVPPDSIMYVIWGKRLGAKRTRLSVRRRGQKPKNVRNCGISRSPAEQLR